MDFTTHAISAPCKGVEHDYFCSNKGKHFFNSLGLVDYAGLFLDFELGFAGHANDQCSWTLSAVGGGELPLGEGHNGMLLPPILLFVSPLTPLPRQCPLTPSPTTQCRCCRWWVFQE
jgi:hypothetical protein